MRKLACAAFLILSALPVLRDDYLFSDDYYWYDLQHSRPADATHEATMMDIMNGRPVHLLGFLALNQVIGSRASFIPLRLVGVALMLLTAWLLARVLRRIWPEDVADIVATAIVALPGFVLYVFWLIGVPCLLAAPCAIAAFSFALDRKYLLAAALMMAGLSTYQPHALIYFALLALWLVAQPRAEHAKLFALGIGSIALYYVFARGLVAAFSFVMPERGTLVFAPFDKLRWLAFDAAPFAAKLWSLMLPEIAGVVFLVAAFVFGRRASLGTILLVCVACALTVFPHLVVRETVVRWRVLLPLSCAFALLAFAALDVARWPRHLLQSVAVVLMLLRTVELARYGVAPERALLGATAALLDHHDDVRLLRPGDNDAACVPRVSNDEFTAPSSQRDFASNGLVRLASELHHIPRPRLTGDGFEVDLRTVPVAYCREFGAEFP